MVLEMVMKSASTISPAAFLVMPRAATDWIRSAFVIFVLPWKWKYLESASRRDLRCQHGSTIDGGIQRSDPPFLVDRSLPLPALVRGAYLIDSRSPDGGVLLKFVAAAVVAALCGACEMAGAWAGEHELAPQVLFVRQPPADASAAGLAPLLAQPPATADGSEARPFATLRAALKAAGPGELLRIEEGIWRERLEITRPVVLLG